jgi:hypothetical protein
MKKAIFLLATLVLVISCRDDYKLEKDDHKQKREDLNPNFTDKQLIEFLEKIDSSTSEVCGDIIVVKGVVATEPNPPIWPEVNPNYYPTANPADLGICPMPKFYIDIQSILKKKSDYKKAHLAWWLNRYGKYICYEETYDIIECAHRIKDSAALEYVDLCKILDIKTLKQIKDELDNQTKQTNYFIRDDYNKYENYMDFSFNTSDEISFVLKSKYQETGDYFSIPLLRSIAKKYNLNNGSAFEFMKADYYGVKDRIVFAVTDSKNVRHFYDFSQIPPNAGSRILLRSFSPL